MLELTQCVVCQGNVEPVIDLGHLYPSAFVNNRDDKEKFTPIKTVVNWCEKCRNMQSNYMENGENLFREYYYRSAVNKQMRDALYDIVTCGPVVDTVTMTMHDGDDVIKWLDIAANDMTMCEQVESEYDAFVVGIDPSIIEERKKTSGIFINEFFSAELIQRLFDNKAHAKFDVITCIAMMYDICDIHKFVEDVKVLLDENGVFIVQLMDLESRLKTYAIDDVCNQHVVCYSLECLRTLFAEHGLEIFNCEYNKTNCASLRIYVGHKDNHPVSEMVDTLILFQRENFTKEKMIKWGEDVKYKLGTVKRYLEWMKNIGKQVVLIGASTKASTLLQVAGIDHNLINTALERSSFKYHKYMMESGIPIISEDEFLKTNNPSECVFVLAIWAFKDGIVKNYNSQLFGGSQILVPFPSPVVINIDKETLIGE